jgi:hypothetical protein
MSLSLSLMSWMSWMMKIQQLGLARSRHQQLVVGQTRIQFQSIQLELGQSRKQQIQQSSMSFQQSWRMKRMRTMMKIQMRTMMMMRQMRQSKRFLTIHRR